MTESFSDPPPDDLARWRLETIRRFGAGVASVDRPCAYFLLGPHLDLVGALREESVSWFADQGGCVVVAPAEYARLHPDFVDTADQGALIRDAGSVAEELVALAAQNRQHVLFMPEAWSTDLALTSAHVLHRAGHQTTAIVLAARSTGDDEQFTTVPYRALIHSLKRAVTTASIDDLYKLDHQGVLVASACLGADGKSADDFFKMMLDSPAGDNPADGDSPREGNSARPDQQPGPAAGRRGQRRVKLSGFTPSPPTKPRVEVSGTGRAQPGAEGRPDGEPKRGTATDSGKRSRGVKIGQFRASVDPGPANPIELPPLPPLESTPSAGVSVDASCEAPPPSASGAERALQRAVESAEPSLGPPASPSEPLEHNLYGGVPSGTTHTSGDGNPDVERRRQLQARIRRYADDVE